MTLICHCGFGPHNSEMPQLIPGRGASGKPRKHTCRRAPGDATKQEAVKQSALHRKKGRHSVDEGLSKDFYRKDGLLDVYLKGSLLQRSGPFGEPPDSWKL